jgi:phenylalanine-4-hydroxylase
VKKLPLTIDCIDYSYDITEPQPQLFVAPDFSRLLEVLEELSSQLAYRTGGLKGLEKAIRAETVNTIQLNSGLQISARLKNVICDSAKPAYLQFDGPTQLCLDGEQINNQGVSHHPHGFGSPVGHLISESKCLSQMSESEHRRLGIVLGRKAELKFTSGVVVSGHVASLTRDPDSDRLLIVSFTDCWVKMNQQILFDPAWGVFDMAVGSSVTSVFGGPADRSAYGETDDFAAKVIPKKSWSPLIVHKHELYQKVREIREGLSSRRLKPDESTSQMVDLLLEQVESNFPHDWLIRLEILELGRKLPSESWRPRVELELRNLSDSDSDMRIKVADGLRVMN